MHADGGWFSFGSIGEAVRFLKVKRVTVEVGSCLLCRPFNRFGEVLMSRLNVRKPRTGCDARAPSPR